MDEVKVGELDASILTTLTYNEPEEEEELQSLSGPGVNKVSVRSTSVAKPQGIGVGCNTTSPVKGVDTILVTGGVTSKPKGRGGSV